MKPCTFLSRQSQQKTPLLIKIGVVIGIWIFGSGLLKLKFNTSWWSLASAIIVLAQVAALIAIWNLRKWGIYAAAFFGAAGIAYMYSVAISPVSVKVLTIAIVFRLIPIVPALIYWKKFNN
jgi:hypothetical protein